MVCSFCKGNPDSRLLTHYVAAGPSATLPLWWQGAQCCILPLLPLHLLCRRQLQHTTSTKEGVAQLGLNVRVCTLEVADQRSWEFILIVELSYIICHSCHLRLRVMVHAPAPASHDCKFIGGHGNHDLPPSKTRLHPKREDVSSPMP